jgi:methionyl-tRNA formyltransferase
MRVAIIGGELFGLHCLRQLISLNANIRALFTHRRDDYYEQIGQGMDSGFYTSCATVAKEGGIPLYHVKNINGRKNIDRLKRIKPDLIFVFGWSQIIGRELLEIPPQGILGFHPTLLPKRRGGAPLNWAIIDGLEQTGQTLFYYTNGIDAGDIVGQATVPIRFEDTCKTMYDKLTQAALELLEQFFPLLEQGRALRVPQNHDIATSTPRRRPEDGLIEWGASARQIYNLVRGVTKPYPGAFTLYKGLKFTAWSAQLGSGLPDVAYRAGQIVSCNARTIAVGTGEGIIELAEIRVAGEDMTAGEFVSRFGLKEKDMLGDTA